MLVVILRYYSSVIHPFPCIFAPIFMKFMMSDRVVCPVTERAAVFYGHIAFFFPIMKYLISAGAEANSKPVRIFNDSSYLLIIQELDGFRPYCFFPRKPVTRIMRLSKHILMALAQGIVS